MSELTRLLRAITSAGVTRAVWSWDAACPVAVTVRVGGREAVLGRDLLEDLLAQTHVEDGSPQVDLPSGGALIAIPKYNGLHLVNVAGMPASVVVTDLAGVGSLLAESFVEVPPCPDLVRCGAGMCAQHSRLASWADEALARLVAAS